MSSIKSERDMIESSSMEDEIDHDEAASSIVSSVSRFLWKQRYFIYGMIIGEIMTLLGIW